MSSAHRGAKGLVVALPIAFTAGLLSTQALAAEVVLTEFGGRKAEVLRAKVRQALSRVGHDVTLSETSGEDLSKSQALSLARGEDADAVIVGTISRPSMRKWKAVLQVRSGATGKKLGKPLVFRSTWLAGLSKELLDKAAKRLKPLLRRAEKQPRRASPPQSPEPPAVAQVEVTAKAKTPEQRLSVPEAESEEPIDGDSVEDSKPLSSVPEDGALFRVAVRGGAVRRSLRFEDDIYQRLRTYDVNMGVYQIEGIVYPFTRPVGDKLGLIASYEAGVSGTVTDTDFNRQFDADFQEFFVGLRARFPVDEHEVGFDLTYGLLHAGLEDPTGQSNVPDADYSVVRTSLHGALDLGPIRGVLAAGFRLPLGYGEMSDQRWFPRVSGYGAEATAGASYAVTDSIVLELTGTLRRFVLEMNSEPADAELDCQGPPYACSEVAGGAVDRYLGGYLGISYRQ